MHVDVEATHASYNAAMETLLVRAPCPERTSLMVATHNRPSVEHAVSLLQRGIATVPRDHVSFGQLLGMADHLTFTLGSARYRAYKYVPFGEVKEVLPYLIRRAQENCDALSGASEQRAMMLREVWRRWSGR